MPPKKRIKKNSKTDDDVAPSDIVVEPRRTSRLLSHRRSVIPESEASDIPDVIIIDNNPPPPPPPPLPPSETLGAENPTPKPQSESDKHKTRVVMINYKQREKFCSNHVVTSKYSFFTFFFFFLYEQFRRISNIFFVCMALLQQIDGVSPTGRYTTAMPLAVIFLVSAVKEILEDVKRHTGDANTNNQEVLVFHENDFHLTKWKDIMVGDFVRMESETFVPADLVLYSSSEAFGMCYIETANLDGETNLKLRQALPQTTAIKDKEDITQLKGFIECGVPNRMIYEFAGSLKMEAQAGEALSLGPDQLVLRGAKLRNTKWIIGQVIYTGHDTKLMKNSTTAPLKRSTLEQATNVQISILFVVLVLMSALSTIMYESIGHLDYINSDDHAGPWTNFLQFLTFILLYNNLIPISLSVTLECVRFMQAMFINWDADLYHEASDTSAQARTSNLNEELGQIRYIFSDKTGTLTCNVMEFKGCTVGGTLYPYEALFPNAANGIPIPDDVTRNPLIQSIKGGNELAEEFLIALAVCHYVIPEVKILDDGAELLVYNAASPDERALVEAAQKFGFVFISRTPSMLEISVHGEKRDYQILNLIEFTSTRKRMTVILKCPDGKIRLYCKGADSVIMERLSTTTSKEEHDLKHTQEHLDYFATEGLRTLCVGMKILSEKEHRDWNIKFQKAVNSVLDRDTEVNNAAEQMETKLALVGSTAIEDKLQDHVPETIASFLEAGISVWVLTGDKQETAINIGNSCHLITPSMEVLIINQGNEADTLDCIKDFARGLHVNLDELKKKGKKAFDNIIPCNAAVVIDGKTLSYALADKVRNSFLCLCCSCMAAIVCRAAPMQKAEIVEYVTKLTGAVTLSIGDGANDVAMIQKAHVGVGISGNEGLQAACASDYSIAQFYFLKKLLFVHGAWSHDRITKAIFYSFYKNICLYIIELWFAIYSAWSGQIIFERWAITTYNLIFVCMQPLVIGIFEQNCSMELRMKYPLLYLSTSHGAFSVKKFSLWIFTSLLHSAALYWLSVEFFATDDGVPSSIWEQGREGSYLVLGNAIYTYVVIVVSLKLGLETRAWTKYTHISIWGSILMWLIFLSVYSYVWSDTTYYLIGNDVYDMAQQLYSSPTFWISFIVIPIAILIPDLMYVSLMGSFLTNVPNIYRDEEIQRQRDLRTRRKSAGFTSAQRYSLSMTNLALESVKNKNDGHQDEHTTENIRYPDTVDDPSVENHPHHKKKLSGPNRKSNHNTGLTNANMGPQEVTLTKTTTATDAKKQEKEHLNVISSQDIASIGPTVWTYCPLQKKTLKRKLGSILHKVDDSEPDQIAAEGRRPTMTEVITAMYLQEETDQEEKNKLQDEKPSFTEPLNVTSGQDVVSVGPTVWTYCPLQEKTLKRKLGSILHKVDDPEPEQIAAEGRRPTMMEVITAMYLQEKTDQEEKAELQDEKPSSTLVADISLTPVEDVKNKNTNIDPEGNNPTPQEQEVASTTQERVPDEEDEEGICTICMKPFV